jgi:hypothetical protein
MNSWKATTLHLGAMVGVLSQRTARCSVENVTEEKAQNDTQDVFMKKLKSRKYITFGFMFSERATE